MLLRVILCQHWKHLDCCTGLHGHQVSWLLSINDRDRQCGLVDRILLYQYPRCSNQDYGFFSFYSSSLIPPGICGWAATSLHTIHIKSYGMYQRQGLWVAHPHNPGHLYSPMNTRVDMAALENQLIGSLNTKSLIPSVLSYLECCGRDPICKDPEGGRWLENRPRLQEEVVSMVITKSSI